MSFSRLSSMQLYVHQPYFIDVEVDISVGLNHFSIVGLPDKAVEEAKDRISAAIKNSGFTSPKSKNQKIVISLAPAELRKEGAHFDFPIALAYLLGAGEIRFDPQNKIFVGELSLDGSLRSIKGVLAYVIAAKKRGIKEVYIPFCDSEEASVVEGIKIFPIKNITEIVKHFEKEFISPVTHQPVVIKERKVEIDFREVKGQEGVKRALLIAASGRHSIMMYGPPGTGKTMLAKAFSGILPELSYDDILEVTTIHSSVGISSGLIFHPPFRAPHHGASYFSMIGGGAYPKPGEITLAHKGVLFMDEFPEFKRDIIESMRLPLEEKEVRISRLKNSSIFPADFLLIAAMNPCPCGFRGSVSKSCSCSDAVFQRYRRSISGPIMDRIDMWVEVSEVDYRKFGNVRNDSESTATIRQKVIKARERSGRNGQGIPTISEKCRSLLNASSESLHLSARGYHKVIKLSRTIADLDSEKNVQEKHILEALQYRSRF